jgi:hypothetical protein
VIHNRAVTCVFCGRGPTTKEHALPRWIRESFPRGEITHAYEHPSGERREWRSTDVALEVGAVCGNCNHGWMSALEGAVKPTLERMFRGERVRMSAGQSRDVATWALKTTLMLQLAEPEYARIVQRELYGELFRRRDPGPDVQVWAAANSFGGGVATGVRGLEVATPAGGPVPTWASALCLAHLILILFDAGPPGVRPVEVAGPLLNALVGIWPPSTTVTWPPPARLDPQQQRLILHMLAASATEFTALG